MQLSEYQAHAVSTAIYPDQYEVNYPILGLVGEAGELANKYKKILRDGDGTVSYEKAEELMHELGDVLWYVAALADDLGYNLEEVAEVNVAKLKSRQERNVLGGSGDLR